MIPSQPNFLSMPFSQNGNKNTIPSTNDGGQGLASLEFGFPQITETPLAIGGIPPKRKDFNGILYALSTFAFFAQSGGQYAYSNTINYIPKSIVVYNNIFYICIKQNGIDSANGVKAPTDTEYWQPLIEYLLDGLAVGTPIGTIIMWASATNPQDGGVWLDCDGQSCTAYPKLVSVLGVNTVPNLQGLFPRCVGSQALNVTIDGTTASQTFNGGTVGTKQSDAIRNITGWFKALRKAGAGPDLADAVDGSTFSVMTGETYNSAVKYGEGDQDGTKYNFDISKVVPVAAENHPASVALRFLIKAQ